VDLEEIEIRPAPVPVRVAPLARRKTAVPLEVEGGLAASRAVLLKAPTSGELTGLDLTLGDLVEAGATLCAIGDTMARQRALAAQASVHQHEAALAEREELLLQAQNRDEPKERLRSFELKLRVAEHKLEQEKVQLARHELLLENLLVRAPFSGRVASVHAATGGTVVTGNALVEIVEVDPIVLVLEVPTWVARRCRPDDELEVRAVSDETPRRGRVARWSPTASDDVRRVLIEIDNADGHLAAGERATAILEVGDRDAYFAPRGALHHEKTGTTLQLVEHGKARLRSVRVLGGDEREVEVAGSLASSFLVVLDAERPLADDTEVVITGDH
jgi:RND family efflux transporter MFP subunit